MQVIQNLGKLVQLDVVVIKPIVFQECEHLLVFVRLKLQMSRRCAAIDYIDRLTPEVVKPNETVPFQN
jgi:hypothetical protein